MQLKKDKRKPAQIYHCNFMKPSIGNPEQVSIISNISSEKKIELPTFGKPTDPFAGTDEVLHITVRPQQLTASHLTDLRRLLEELVGLFSDVPGKTAVVTHDMELTSSVPIKRLPYQMAPRQQAILKKRD